MIISEGYKEKFYSNVQKTDSCWVYSKSIEGSGYGYICVNGKTIGAHRFSYLIHYGKIPHKMFVCHSCDNPSCVNPKHLFLGSHKDNMQDMVKKNRGSLKKGAHRPIAKLTETEVKEIFNLSGDLSQRELAKKFSVSQGLISNILNHKSWKIVTASLKSMSGIGNGSDQKGSRSSRAKLSEDQALYIFKMHGLKSRHDLAKEFNIAEVTIRKIWGKQTWRHVTC